MVEVTGRRGEAPLASLASPRRWPLPGLLHLAVAILLAAIVVLGIQFSNALLEVLGQRLLAKGSIDWTLPVQLLFAFWAAITVVVATLMTVADLWDAPRQLGAAWDREAWLVFGTCRETLLGSLKRDEQVLGYLEVDHPDMRAPVLFERALLVTLLACLGASLVGVDQLVGMDGYQAFSLWLSLAPVATVVACAAVLWCRPSRALCGALALSIPLVHRVHWGVDPMTTGPALGLPAPALSVALAATVLAVLAHAWRGFSTRHLLVFTDLGARLFRVQGDDVALQGGAEHPLRVVATPLAAGCRLQIANREAKEKMRPVVVQDHEILARLRTLLGSRGLALDTEGSDEASGIAGRLGEVPLLGWVLIAALLVTTNLTLVPPVVGRLQVATLLEKHQAAWQRGATGELEAGLDALLETNPNLGPAVLIRERIRQQKPDQTASVEALQTFLDLRKAWTDTPLVDQAQALLAEAKGES